ncbi:conserved Plasmodium protein, unknown function [Plasmodium vinckei vinckei]|uniref:Uncharacterized protein n=1 Tax=Plasmodium vinckei vinckei TaxID=54757 RepID=A0A449BXQ1_PLAVN|nr:conserved Plasmodium protein, unknown function [Plasmodium vinckei vinckei]KEG04577.1 hypothetical protein YYE_00152 [Plasmodium vinckei vinckei]VEV58228.1 conserved Plasmodium protein, unknown function [Plasmodium vinckei vinckei]
MFFKKILRNANENENNDATNTQDNVEKDISDTINEKDSNLNETECKENGENSHINNFNNQTNSNDNLQNGNNICSTNENIINNKPDNEPSEINNINENININQDKTNGIEINNSSEGQNLLNNVVNPAPKKRGRKKRGEVAPNPTDLNLQLTKRVSVKNFKYHSFIEQEVGKKRRGRKSNSYYENDIKTNESMFFNSSMNNYENMQHIDNGHSMLNLNANDNINNNDVNNINNYYMYDRPPYYYCDIMGKDGIIPPPESGISDYQNVYANEFINNNLYNGMQTDNINYNYYLMDNNKQENPMFFHKNLIPNEVMNTNNPPNTNTNTVVEPKRRGRKKKIRNENIMNNNNFVNNTNLGVPIKLGDNLNNDNPLNGQVNPLPIVEKKKRGRKKKNINNPLNTVTGLNIKQNGMEYKNEGIIDANTNSMHGPQINNMGIGDIKNENTEGFPFSSNYNNNSSAFVDYNGQSNGLNFQRENNDNVYNQNDNIFLKKRKYTKRKHKDRRSIDGNKHPRNQMSKYVSFYNNSINDKNYTIHNASNISRTIEKNIFGNNKIKEFKTNNNKPLANEPYQIKEEFMNNVNSINTVFNFNEEFIKFLKKVNNFDDIDYNSMLSFLGNVQIKLTTSLNEDYSTENFNIHNVDHTIYAMKKIVDILNNNNEILSKLNQLEYKIYCDYYITKKQNSMKELHNNTDNNANKLSETEHKDENNSQDNPESNKNKTGNTKLNEDKENQTNGDLEHIKANNNDLKVNDDSGKICENDKEGIYQETDNIKDDAHNNKKEEPSNEYNINKLYFNKNVDFICNELNEFIKNTLKNENIFYSLYSDGRYHNTSEKSLYKNYVSTKLYKHNNIIDRSKIGRREKIILNKLYKNGEICEEVINRTSKYVDENEPMEEKDQLLLNRYTELFRKINNINKGHSNSYNQINKPYNNGLQIDQHTLINKDDNMNFHKNLECNSVCPNCVSDVSNDNLMMSKNEVMGKADTFYMSPNNSTNINNSSHIDVNNYSTGNTIVEHNKDVESDEMGTCCNMHDCGVNNINEQYKKSNNDNKHNDNLCECFEGTINQESMDEMSKLNNAETTITYDDLEYKNNPLDKKINDKTNIFDNNTTKENNKNQCLLNNGISNIMSVNDNDNNESCNLTQICNTNSENICDSNNCCNNNINMDQYDYKKNLQSLLTETLNFRDDKLMQMKENKSQKEMLNCLKMVSKIKQKFFDECTQMINNQIFTLEKNFRIPDCSLSMPSNELCYNTNS